MTKKKSFLFLGFLLVLSSCFAQKSRIMLFDDYISGKVLFLNRAQISAPLNYDASNHNMMFKQGTDELILTNSKDVDTIFIDQRKFIPAGSIYLEVVDLPHGTVFINWNIRKIDVGIKGAYGAKATGRVKYLDIRKFSQTEANENPDINIVTKFDLNEYWFQLDGRYKKCKKVKDVFKLFPNKENEINEFLKKHSVAYGHVEDMLALLDYCLGLSS